MNATRNGYAAFKFTLSDPGDGIKNTHDSARMAQYRLGWNAYINNVFDNMRDWGGYAEVNKLHPHTQPIYNPVTRLVDFYASHIYQGSLSTDGNELPGGELQAIPLAKDTPDEIKEALGQLYQWGNWAAKLDLLAVYGAAMGDVAVEGVEDVDSGRVWPQVVTAQFITDVRFDARGNVIAYTKQYSYYDYDINRTCTYKKIVTKEQIQEFRDDIPYDFGNGSTYENIYGFAPLVIIPHRNLGTFPGAPAVRSWNKIEYLNNIATRLDIALRVKFQSPTAVIGHNLKLKDLREKDVRKNDEDVIKIVALEGEGSVFDLNSNLDIDGSLKVIESKIGEIEHDHPEITMYNRLRDMSQLTGPAAEILMGDVKGYVDRARTSYDNGMMNILKMLLTMGGMRANERAGGWRDLTDQQRKFLPFNLNSYEHGDLEFDIVSSRPLIKKTKLQYWQEEQARLQALQVGVIAGEPLEWQEKQSGMSDEDWERLKSMQDEAATRNYLAQNNDQISAITE